MEVPYLGELLSAAAPLAWAVAVILFRRGGEDVAPIPLNLFKSTLGFLLLGLTLALIGGVSWQETSRTDLIVLAASGVVGVALADTLFFYALNELGASRLAVVGASYMPMIVLLSFLALGERLGPWQWLGGALVIVAVLMASSTRGDPSTTPVHSIRGLVIALLAFGLMAAGVVMAKPALDRTPVIFASTVRLGGAVLVMLPLAAALPGRRAFFAPFRPSPVWRYIVPGAVLGTYLAYMLWLGGIKYTDVSIAAILNQLYVVFTVILAAIFLREKITALKVAGVVVAVVGSVMVVAG